METVTDFIFLSFKITADRECSHEIKRHLLLGRKARTNPDSILKSRDITLPTKVHLVKAMAFPVVMYECENWTIKKAEPPNNWCFWTVVLEKTLVSPLDCKEIQPVHPKGDLSRIFIGRTYAESEAPILWPPDSNSRLIGKDPDPGKDWSQEEKGMTENEMLGWQRMRWLDGITNSVDMSLEASHALSMGSQKFRHHWVAKEQQHMLLESVLVSFFPHNWPVFPAPLLNRLSFIHCIILPLCQR